MSYIASFYIIDIENTEDLALAAEFVPKPKKLFGFIPKKVVDYKEFFWKTIQEKAKELDEYLYSGFAFVDLLTMYPMIESSSTSNLGDRLSKAMDSTYLSFTETEANQIMDALGDNPPSKNEIRDHFKIENPSENPEDWEIPIIEAWKIMKAWLSKVTSKNIGLFSVG